VATIDASGSLTEIEYDAAGHAVKTIRYANRPSATQLASLVDSGGQPTNVTLASIRPPSDPGLDRVSFTLYDRPAVRS